ncbi:MAG: hypothetical protein DRP00_03675 [Candidatus Aenigmatarchaeota archaeon]|nr:MAG: hypothetical protein DRP00_03675 [Candidatus Aenigmarchaeota archaeon]
MKGVMFSIMIISITAAILAVILAYSFVISGHRERIVVEVRTNEMYYLYRSILRDFDKSAEVIVPRAISSALSYVITNGMGLDEADKRLEELVVNGTLYRNEEHLMENATFPEWIRKIEELALLRGFILNLTLEEIKIKPWDSWNLLLEANLSINLTEKNGIASLIRNVTKRKLISVIGFEDPIYPLKTLGRATNVITPSPYYQNFTQILASGTSGNDYFYGESLVLPKSSLSQAATNKSRILITDDISGSESLVEQKFGAVVCECYIESLSIPFIGNVSNAMNLPNRTNLLVDGDTKKVWYIENLKEHLRNSFYIPSSKGASFLDRLEGRLEVQEKYQSQSDRIIGMESLVNKNYLLTLDLSVDSEKTNVDHLYFSDSPHPGFRIKGFDNDLRIDSEACGELNHTSIYQVQELLI